MVYFHHSYTYTGRTYRFDQNDNSNSSHPIAFYLKQIRQLNIDGVTTNGSAGSSGAYTQIVVSDETPNSFSLSVYCSWLYG